MKNLGFCLLKNVKGHDEAELLEAVRTFHSLPLELKMAMAPKHLNGDSSKTIYRGYFPFFEDDPSHKEMYDMGRPLSDISSWERKNCPLYEDSPWIEDGLLTEKMGIDELAKLKKAREVFNNHWRLMHELSLKLISCLAIGLGK
mmetsp:Transcript_5858/g.9445  ORF Transcript_5858/g.9445 Transcript_5858/m.9445 type:complete len:144 (+) Transcript_5858:186-617(+)